MNDFDRPVSTERTMKDHNDRLSWLFVGIGLGILAGLLWAPRAGRETRARLRDGADLVREQSEKIRAGSRKWRSRAQGWFCHRSAETEDS